MPEAKSFSVSFLVYFDGALHPVTLEQGESKVLETGRRQTEEGWEFLGADVSFDGDCVTLVSARDGTDCDGRLSQTAEFTCHKDKLASVKSANGLYWLPDWERVSEQQRDYQAERAGY